MAFNFLSNLKDKITNDPDGRYDSDSDGDDEAFRAYNKADSDTDYENPASGSTETSITNTDSFDALFGYLYDAINEELTSSFQSEVEDNFYGFANQNQSLPNQVNDLVIDQAVISDGSTGQINSTEIALDPNGVYKVEAHTSYFNESSSATVRSSTRLMLNENERGYQIIPGTEARTFIPSEEDDSVSTYTIIPNGKRNSLRLKVQMEYLNFEVAPLVKLDNTFALSITKLKGA
jgi:hypothetical protein